MLARGTSGAAGTGAGRGAVDTGHMRPVLCPVLVGRDEEIRCLRAGLARAQAGHGSTVLLAGEAGIGKSRLACEVAALARLTDLIVLAGRAVAGGVPAPYRQFAEALMSAVRPGGLPKASELDPFRPALCGSRSPQSHQGSSSMHSPCFRACRSRCPMLPAVVLGSHPVRC